MKISLSLLLSLPLINGNRYLKSAKFKAFAMTIASGEQQLADQIAIRFL